METLYYVARNGLMFAYRALRAKDRYAGQTSPYEDFMVRLSEAVNPQRKTDLCVPYGDVEAFYQGSISEEEFISAVHSRVIPKTSTVSELSALFPLVWDAYTSVPAHQSLCQTIPRLCGRQLWEIFLKLDKEGRSGVHIDDVCDLVMRIFKANGHNEKRENIQEWFCGETYIDFWSLMLALAETYSSFLQPSIIQELYDTVMLEVLMRGKLTKKGHMIHNWRDRYFILTSSSLTYYETQEILAQKGTIAITAGTQMQIQPDTKNYQNRFKVVDGMNGTPYEISAPDPQTLQQWKDAIQLAIKIQQVNSRNFLHGYRLAKESLLPSTAAATSTERAAARKTPSPTTTETAHKSLSSSKSVPLVDEKPQQKNKISSPNLVYKPRQLSPVPPTASYARVPNGHVTMRLDDSLNDPPLLPPQRFSDDSNLRLQGAVSYRPRKQRGEDGRQLRRRHSSILQRSDLEKPTLEVDHISVGGDNYAVVKKKVSLPRPPQPVMIDESPPEQRAALEVPEQKAKVSPNSSPKPPRKPPGYVQLEFQSDKPKGQVVEDTPLPKDVRTKYSYSTIIFENEPKKDVALAKELKKNKPVPAPPPRYDRLHSPMKPNTPTSETSPKLKRKEKSLDERTIAYADVVFNPPKPDSQALNKSPRLWRKQNGGHHHSLDYADIDFTSTGSPSVPSRKVSSPVPAISTPEPESPYVNVVHQGAAVRPRVPPRQRPPVVSPSHENPPPLPLKRKPAKT